MVLRFEFVTRGERRITRGKQSKASRMQSQTPKVRPRRSRSEARGVGRLAQLSEEGEQPVEPAAAPVRSHITQSETGPAADPAVSQQEAPPKKTRYLEFGAFAFRKWRSLQGSSTSGENPVAIKPGRSRSAPRSSPAAIRTAS